MATSAVVVSAVFVVLKFTPFGREQRAVADDPVLARVVGIKANRVIAYTWLLTGALAGLAGVALGATTGTFDAQLGFNFLLLTFAAVIVGGLGRPARCRDRRAHHRGRNLADRLLRQQRIRAGGGAPDSPGRAAGPAAGPAEEVPPAN